MNIPKQLKIGGHVVNVEFVKYTPHINGDLGGCWDMYNAIQIKDGLQESVTAVTFLHEIIHYILSILGHEYKKDNLDTVHNETFVEQFSQVFYQILKDNNLNFTDTKDD